MMQNFIKTILVLSTLSAVFSAGAVVAEDVTPRQRPNQEQRAQRLEQMKERWNKIDANHDGKISREEAQQNAPKMAEHFDQLDANGDGLLTPEEMRQAHQARQAQRAERGAGQRPAKPESGT